MGAVLPGFRKKRRAIKYVKTCNFVQFVAKTEMSNTYDLLLHLKDNFVKIYPKYLFT